MLNKQYFTATVEICVKTKPTANIKTNRERNLNLQSTDTNRVTSACLKRKPIAFEVQCLSADCRH